MPELPEVETMVDRLQRYVGCTVLGVYAADGEDTSRYLDHSFVPPQTLKGVFRRGKFMVFMLEDCALLAHNAMSGYWDEADDPWTFNYVEGDRASSETDIRARIELDDDSPGQQRLRVVQFHDARKFGYIHMLTPEQLAQKLSKLGPDALQTQHLYEPLGHAHIIDIGELIDSKKPIKQLLLEQERIAGVGNIYAAEALWMAHISPKRPGNSLSEQERVNLLESIRSVLSAALARKLDYEGLRVYRREICPDCRKAILAEELKGRTTYWCPACQS